LAEEAGGGGARQPILVLGGGAENFDGLLGVENPRGLGGFSSDGGIGILQAGFDQGTRGGAVGRIESQGFEGIGAHGGQSILQRSAVGLGLGIEAEDLAGLSRGDLGLAKEKSQMETLLAQRGAVGGFLERGIDQGAGFFEAAGFEELVGTAGGNVSWFGATREAENGHKGKENPVHAG